MGYNSDESIHEEIISFLGTLVHDLPRIEESRGIPRIGYYLTDPYMMDRIVDGKLHERPWQANKLIFKLTGLDELESSQESFDSSS